MSRKGENIYKRKDGRWEGRYIKGRTSMGKAKYGYVYARTYREAKLKLIEVVTTQSKSLPIVSPMSSETFGHVAIEWFETTKMQLKESTCNKYWNLLNSYILPEFGKKLLSDITHDFIEEQCNSLLYTGGKKGTGLSAKTVTDTLSVIRNILQFAIKKGQNVPCDARAVRIKQCSKEMRVLSRNEQEKLCRYLYSNLDACNIGILVSLFTGLRVGEICALRWEDISFSDHTIHVHQTLQRVQDREDADKKTKIIISSPKSACSIRTIPLPDNLTKILISHKSASTGYFLTNSNQNFIEPRTMQNRFKRALQKSSIEEANYHSLRHTFATRCVELGFDIKSLSEILGHASVNITMNRYVHPSLELKKENMEKLSVLLAVK